MRPSSPAIAALLVFTPVTSVATSGLRKGTDRQTVSSLRKVNFDSFDVDDAFSPEEYQRLLSEQHISSEEGIIDVEGGFLHSDNNHHPEDVVNKDVERQLMVGHDNMYSPLSCNNGVDWAALCAPGVAHSLAYLAVNTAAGSVVTIPCGECALVDTMDGSTIEIPNGLNIEGKLHFPANARVTLRTTSVIVQGIFSTESPEDGTKIPAADGSGVKVLLYGQDDVKFVPHIDNIMASGGNMTHPKEVNVGKKVFAIAGGKLDVRAIDPSCPSWEPLLDTSSTKVPPPVPTPYINGKPELPDGCSRTVVDLDFKVGHDFMAVGGRFGGSYTIEPHDADANSPGDPAYLSYKRNAPHEGPKFKLVGSPNCVLPNVGYLVSGRARLKNSGTLPTCTIEGGSAGNRCIKLNLWKPLNKHLGGMQGGQAKYVNEGEWFDFSFSAASLTPSQVNGAMEMWFHGPEGGVSIELDWVKIELPAEGSLPTDDEEGCMDLAFGNGDAEQNGLNTYPWASSSGDNYLHIANETDSATGEINHFYRQERPSSWWGMWYKKHGFKMNCVQAGKTYTFRMKYRRNADDESGINLRFGWIKAEGGWGWSYFGSCPKSSNVIGWVNCEATMTATDSMVGSSGYQLWIYGGGQATVDFDDISFTTTYESPPVLPQDQIVLSPAAASCWSVGSKLVLTSSTTDQDDAHEVTIKSSDSTTGVITLEAEVPFTTTAKDDTDFPVEVALLNRNFVLEAEPEPAEPSGDSDHGGHLIILHTPNVAQVLEGVEVVNFGQQGNLGRYPVHFHMCEAVAGSRVSRNVIKYSNQRGIVIHGSHNITVEDNVLYEIHGHGYFLEDGVEQYNSFLRNLGALFRAVPADRLVPSGSLETDNQPSVFWMSNTLNFWEGNVAAGGHIGFWIEMSQGDARGKHKNMPMFEKPDFDRTKLPLLQFKDNDAHSSSFCGMSSYPNRYTPTEEADLVNLRTYRNKHCGILFHVNSNMKMLGGVAADNGHRQIWNQLADDIVIDGTEIIGLRPEFEAAMSRAGKTPSCKTNTMQGITFSMNQIISGATGGLTLTNVNFSKFDCATSSIAIEADHLRVGGNDGDVYNSPTAFEGVSFGTDVAAKISVCRAMDAGHDHVALEDITGSLSPTGRPGFLVDDASTSIAGGANCVPIEESCMEYCDDVCLQTLVVSVDSNGDDVEMVISDGSLTAIVLKKVRGDPSYTLTDGKYAISLPAGTFDVSFRDEDGAIVYPDYVLPKLERAPKCSKGETVINVMSVNPTGAYCDELIKNSDFEAGNVDGWEQFFTGLVAVSGGENSSHALKTTGRGHWNAMVTKYLNMDCLTEGAKYDVNLSYKLVDSSDAPIDCGTECPQVSLAYYPNGQQRWKGVGGTVAPFNVGEWNTISGQFTVTSDIATSNKVHISFFDSGRTVTGQFIVDNFTVTKVSFTQ